MFHREVSRTITEMKNITRSLSFAAFAALATLIAVTTNAAPVSAQVPAARAVVVDLYKAHNTKRNDPFFQSKRRSLVDKYFTKTLADLIWNDSVTSQKNNEVGVIDGDPLYDAQDTEIKRFAVGTAVVKGNSGTVPVTFTNFGKKKKIDFRMKKVGGVWKVDDIDYGGETGTLRSWFKK